MQILNEQVRVSPKILHRQKAGDAHALGPWVTFLAAQFSETSVKKI